MRRIAWPLIFTLLALTVLFGSLTGQDSPHDPTSRASHLAQQIRCPTCAGLSAAESSSPLAQSVREEITEQIRSGKTDGEIKAFFVSRYGDTALMSPKKTGPSSIVWLLPVLLVLAGVVGIWMTVRQWRQAPVAAVPAEDRRLVEEALESR